MGSPAHPPHHHTQTLVSHHHGLTSVASAVAPAPAPPFTLWQPELLPLGTPNPYLRGSPCLLQRQRGTMTLCPPPIVPSHRKPEPMWVWSPRAMGVPPPSNGSGGGVSSLQPSCFLGPPQPGTHGPPHNQSAFQRKSTPYVSDSFTLQLAMGGQSAGRLASEPPPPIRELESMCPKGHILQGCGAVKA